MRRGANFSKWELLESVPMEQIRSGLRQVMGKWLKTQPQSDAAVLAWPVVCGRDVAARTTATGFSGGVLTVAVPDANWRNQLSAFTQRYLSGFEELIGPVVKEVRFEVEKRQGSPRRHGETEKNQ